MLFTPTVLSLTSSAATSTCKIAGQRYTDARPQVASDFNPVSTLCGYRVSCAEVLLVMRVSRQVGGANPVRARGEKPVHLQTHCKRRAI